MSKRHRSHPRHNREERNMYYMKPQKKEEPVDPKQKIALQKMLVGHFIESVPKDCSKKVVYVMQGDGVYEQRINKLGTFTTQISKATIPGLESNLEEGWVLNVPRIPITLLGTTVSFFRSIYSKYSSEVFLQFYYDIKTEEYIVHCPKQTVSRASVRYENDEIFSDANKILVFEIHSHGTMGAFFSGTDDGDEKADRFYGVIGNVNNFFPDLKLRLSVGGVRTDIKVEELFDLTEEMYHAETFPKDWAERIQKSQVQVVSAVNPVAVPMSWGGDMMDLVSQFESEDHLYSKYECPKEETKEETRDDKEGYYVQEGKDLFFIKEGVKYVVFEDDEKAQSSEPKNTDKYDPYDWRKGKF